MAHIIDGNSALSSATYPNMLSATRANLVISELYYRIVDGGIPKGKALVAASGKQCHTNG